MTRLSGNRGGSWKKGTSQERRKGIDRNNRKQGESNLKHCHSRTSEQTEANEGKWEEHPQTRTVSCTLAKVVMVVIVAALLVVAMEKKKTVNWEEVQETLSSGKTQGMEEKEKKGARRGGRVEKDHEDARVIWTPDGFDPFGRRCSSIVWSPPLPLQPPPVQGDERKEEEGEGKIALATENDLVVVVFLSR